MKWEILNTEVLIKNKWITVEKHKCKISEDKIIEDYYIVKRADFVIIIAEDKGDIYFLKQYRHGAGECVINLPMGFIEEGEKPEETAFRELIEETGYKANSFENLGSFYVSPGFMNTRAYIFYTNDITKDFSKDGDNGEGELELVKIPKKNLTEHFNNDLAADSLSIMAISVASMKSKTF